MAIDFNATTTKITPTFAAHAVQRTYSIWAYREGAGEGDFGRMFDKRTSGVEVELLYADQLAGKYLYGRVWNVAPGEWSFPDPPLNEWHNVTVTYDATVDTNDPLMYLDGVSQTVTEEEIPDGTATNDTAGEYVIGNRGAQSRTWDGGLCEFAIWDAILTPGEVAALGKGFSPLFFPTSLTFYAPLVRNLFDYMGTGTLTGVDTAVRDHPRIIYPSAGGMRRFTTAAGAATLVKDLIQAGILAFPRS